MPQKNSKSRKTLVAVFAHPDDESFGPCCTLHKYTKTHDVYIICATKGEVGLSPKYGSNNTLGEIRAKELEKSAKLIGAKKVLFLGFLDGTLSNSLYHQLASKIESKLKELKPEIVITFEPRGVSGHIDHITVSMATTFVVQKLSYVKKLLYFCLSEEKRNTFGDYFIYFPPGYKKSEITKTVDVSSLWDLKIKAMAMHQSQKSDGQMVLKAISRAPKEEHFLELKK